MKAVCPECGYNAGENGEKILELHMIAQHGLNSPKSMSSEQVARIKREQEVFESRTYLVLGGITVLLGLGLALYGYNIYATLTCNPGPSGQFCFIPQWLASQIVASGYGAVYVGAQETTYGGLLLFTAGTVVVAYWRALKLDYVPRIQLVVLVGIFILILVTALAIAGSIIPFGQRIIRPV
jgi:hypothetical protein